MVLDYKINSKGCISSVIIVNKIRTFHIIVRNIYKSTAVYIAKYNYFQPAANLF